MSVIKGINAEYSIQQKRYVNDITANITAINLQKTNEGSGIQIYEENIK